MKNNRRHALCQLLIFHPDNSMMCIVCIIETFQVKYGGVVFVKISRENWLCFVCIKFLSKEQFLFLSAKSSQTLFAINIFPPLYDYENFVLELMKKNEVVRQFPLYCINILFILLFT
jgi:hypothetical protein